MIVVKDTLKSDKKVCERCDNMNYIIECACGCGLLRFYKNKYGKIRRFISGHQNRGKNHPLYKKIRFHEGYLMIKIPEHPFAHYDGYVYLHRFIYEYFNKCCLLPYIDIHHKNGIKTDHHKHNLIPILNSDHITIHMIGNKHSKKDMTNRRCSDPECIHPTKTHITKKGRYIWFNDNNGGFLCHTCYIRIKNRLILSVY
jgi:hypothetical protein